MLHYEWTVYESKRGPIMYNSNRGWRFTLPFFLGLTLASIEPVSGQIQFQDVTTSSGFLYEGETWGASWGDLDGDNLPDLFVSHHRNVPSVYRNNGDHTFSDVTSAVDASGVWVTSPRADTHGASWTDFDNDGDQDLYVTVGAKGSNQFLVNESGMLVDQTAAFDPAIPRWRARMPIWLDFNKDGMLDLMMASENFVSLFEQTPTGFADRTTAAALACNQSQAGYLADFVGSEELDLICASSQFPRKVYDVDTIGLPFIDSTNQVPRTSRVQDVALGDFDNNGRTDFLIVRGAKRLSGAKKVGTNRVEAQLISPGSREKGVSFQSMGGITISLATNFKLTTNAIWIGAGGRHPTASINGKHEITFTLAADDPSVVGIKPHNTASNTGIYIGYDPNTQTWQILNSPGGTWSYAYLSIQSAANVSGVSASNLIAKDQPTSPKLYMNYAAGFSDQTQAAGDLKEAVTCISAAAADFDNDTDVDVYLVCRGAVFNVDNRLYENLGNGSFRRVANDGGAAGPVGFGSGKGENVVAADYDADGFMDLFVTNGLQMVPEGPGGPDMLLRNVGNGNHWIELDVTGVASNRDGVGAKVYASIPGGVTQMREQNGGYHRWAQHHKRIHFGLAGNTTVDLTIDWPSGHSDTFLAVQADQVYRVTENGTIEPIGIGTPPIVVSPCGKPRYDKATEQGVFVWQDCPGGGWHARMTSGGSQARVVYQGSVVADQNFFSVTGFSIEANDTLDFTTGPAVISYQLGVRGAGQDGFGFAFPTAANVCFGVDGPVGIPVYLGAARTSVAVPFDPQTGGVCQ
jgi:ASPIC and UnbV/FG-GAP-like repeat